MARYTKNDNYFSELTPKNCYWMGFIAADGCVAHSDAGEKMLGFHIKATDYILLETFKADLEYTGIIRKQQQKPYTYKEGNKTGKLDGYIIYPSPSIQMHISNAALLLSDLNLHANIGERKSVTLMPPNITNLAEKIAYITGYFDGDGCLSWQADERWVIDIAGTKELLLWIQEIIQPFISSKVSIRKTSRKETNTWSLRIITTKGTQEFLDLMACTIYSPLRRKHDFDEYWAARNNRKEQIINV